MGETNQSPARETTSVDDPSTEATPLRVLHLTAGSYAGGLTGYLRDLSLAMQRHGHTVVLAGQRKEWHATIEQSGLHWITVPLDGKPWQLWRAYRLLRKYLRQHPVDVIHAHYRRSALVGRMLARRLNLPLLFTLHLTQIPMRGLGRWLSDFGDRTHVPSADARDWLLKHTALEAKRISIVPHGVDRSAFPYATAEDQQKARAALNLPADKTIGGFVGRFAPQKNVQWLLAVARQLAAKRAAVHLVLRGDGPHFEPLRQQIADEGLADYITLWPGGDALPVYQAIDALLLPSNNEGFSLVCAEAMSVGRPVLRTHTAGTHELIREGQTGRATPIDRDAFVEAAVDFLSDRAALRRMGEAAAAHVAAHFTYEQQVAGTLSLYRSIIAAHPAKP
jgi:glycosyltransferase involved in cell wall biosynthesis